MEFNLLTTKDTGLMGAIGETIAWQYLHQKGMIAYRFGTGRPWFPTKEINHRFYIEWLNKRQLEYLNDLRKLGSRLWDFIAIRARDMDKRRKKIYLIEVKTRRVGTSRHDLRGSMKGKIPIDLGKVKWSGFVPLMIVIEFLKDWGFKVTEREL